MPTSTGDRWSAAEPPVAALLSPASVAVVGASPTSNVGRLLCQNLRTIGFTGTVYPVNPRYEEVLGWTCYPSVDQLPEGPDAVVAAVPFHLVPSVLRAAANRGTRAAVVPGGGFTETGSSAHEIQGEVAAVAREYGIAVCGPNSMGVISPATGAAMYIGTIPSSLLPGRVAMVAQSGSVVEAAINMGPRVGWSALVSSGNEAATTIGQYLRFFAEDGSTGAVACFLEGFHDPAGFIDGARALRDADKPLAVLHAGRFDDAVEAITAHSGSLAGTEEVVTGLLHQLGAIAVDDLDELLEMSELLGHGRMPRGRRLFVVTDSGGESNLVRDHAAMVRLELPPPSEAMKRRLQERWPKWAYLGNPIDPWGVDSDYRQLYGEVVGAGADEDVDVLAVAMDKVTPWAGEGELDLGLASAQALIAAATQDPSKLAVLFTVHSTGPAAAPIRDALRQAGIPLLHGLRPAMVAIRRAWWWQQWKPRIEGRAAEETAPLRLAEPGPLLSEPASRDVLEAYRIPVVAGEIAQDADQAAAAAERLGFPVVMKAVAPGVAHKAARGLVTIGVPSADAVRATFAVLMARSSALGMTGRGVQVQATAKGVELICGMRHDAAFGPVVLVGVGGTLTEVIRQVAVRLCPPAPEDLEEMLGESPVGRLLAAAGADPEPVRDVIAALARMALDHPEVREVDVNPLFAGPDGVVAADALVVLDEDERRTT